MKKLIPLLLLFVSLPTLAQRQFDIEVVIFKRLVNAEKINEHWSENLPVIKMAKSGSFSDRTYLEKKGVKMLPKSSYQLNDQVKTLQDHAAFKVLLHKAWRQGDEGKAAAPIFHIAAGKNYADQFNSDGQPKNTQLHNQTVQAIENVSDTPVVKVSSTPLYELDGKLQIYVQHYLYAETTLDLHEPAQKTVMVDQAANSVSNDSATSENNVTANDDSAAVQVGYLESVNVPTQTISYLKTYRMQQKRRMRSNETHYLDNPLLGVVIQVRRVAQ